MGLYPRKICLFDEQVNRTEGEWCTSTSCCAHCKVFSLLAVQGQIQDFTERALASEGLLFGDLLIFLDIKCACFL